MDQLDRVDEDVFTGVLEIERQTSPECVDSTAAWRDSRTCNSRYIAICGSVIELPFHVGIPEPIDASRPIVQDPTVDPLIVQIEVVVSNADLPGPQTSNATVMLVGLVEMSMRFHPFKSTVLLAVVIIFACQEVHDLNIPSMVDNIGCRPAQGGTGILQ